MKQIKLTKLDQSRISGSIRRKITEYSLLPLEDLQALFPTLGGSYKMVAEYVIERKIKETSKPKQNEEVQVD